MKNILQENMRRFGTKNLTEGLWDVAKLAMYKDEFETILTPGQSEDVIARTIDSMIDEMGGPKAAAELVQGALESISQIKSILKPMISRNASLDVTKLNDIVDRLPFSETVNQQLKLNIMKIARDLNVVTRE